MIYVMYATSGQAQKHFSVSEDTLRRWANEGKIKFKTTRGGHRRYKLPDSGDEERRKYIYTRVSSKKQEEDLGRQIEFMQQHYPEFDVISDIGGGANFKRKGFIRLLDEVMCGKVETIAVYSKDRLTRFGEELIKHICQHFDTSIIYAQHENEETTDVDELGRDILTVITHFTARYYGSRKYKDSEQEVQDHPFKGTKDGDK